MADADPLFNLDVVRDFMASKGGKVRNHELVTHFKSFLNDPRRKVQNRERFKTFVNTLSAVKLDETGEKVLVLKKKFRDLPQEAPKNEPDHLPKLAAPKRPKLLDHFPLRDPSPEPKESTPLPSRENASDESAVPMEVSELVEEEVLAGAPLSAERIAPREVAAAERRVSPVEEVPPERKSTSREPTPASREPTPASREPTPVSREPTPVSKESTPVAMEPAPITKVPTPVSRGSTPVEAMEEDQENIPPEEKVDEAVVDGKVPSGPGSAATSREQSVTRDLEAEPLNQSTVSVKKYAEQLNRNVSQSELSSRPRQAKQGSEGREDEHETITLDAVEREWLVTMSSADYQKVHRLLNKNPHLAKRKDFTTGMTALHWAAKHGQVEVVKLLCGSHNALVDSRSNGGYTPLHLAAMHNHEQVIEILVQAYGADANIRDHSGRKAKQYLKNSASTRAQQLLSVRRLSHSVGGSSGAAPFRRVGSYSAKIRSAGHFGIHASVAVRSSWVDRSPSPSPSASPAVTRAASVGDDHVLMPPPADVPSARARPKRSRSRHDKETHSQSDSEMPRSRSTSPRTLATASASDPNLAAQLYQSAV